MANTLELQIVTPEKIVYSEQVELVTLPAYDGEIGVGPQHIPLMTHMIPGEITVRKDGRDSYMAVGEGLVEITGDHVAILTDMAISVEDIDAAKVEEARLRAEARLREKISSEQIASVNSALVHALTQLRVKRRHPRH